MNKRYSLNEYIEIINNYLDSSIGECTFGEDIVHNAMKYSLSIGGKRIRPVLVLEFCRICGGNIEDALPFAAAIEMIHTYSLIHDDLPCMDDDDMRRGMPSCHKKYGEEYALLAGDGLLTRAFGIVAESEMAKKSPEKAVEAIRLLSSLAGVNGMIGGQVVDLRNEDKPCGLDVLQTMDSLKTGALIKCSALLGVVVAGGTKEQKDAAISYAENLGHAFQIVDDILDVIGDEKELGKPIGSDAESNKSTYVSILGIEQSQKYADELTDKAIASLDIFADEADFLKKLALSLVKRKN
ncbi:MAG: polyprenyl synthetase family protein [Clostridia bacterium]|nr:polyprenyl synthetase family protein [Clostridia bacterium]